MKKDRIKVTVPCTFYVSHVMGRWTHGGLYMTMGGGEVTDNDTSVGDIRCTPGGQQVISVKKGKETIILASNMLEVFEQVQKAALELELPKENPEPREKA